MQGVGTHKSLKHPMVNAAQTNFVNSNKKLAVQKNPKIKMQMNMTGPLPKNIVSPKTTTNKSSSKTKHSQYFNNATEVVNQNAYQI